MFNLGLANQERVALVNERSDCHIIDGSFMLCRADARSAKETVSRFAAMYARVPRTRHRVVVFDAASHTFRHDLLPGYKAGRGPDREASLQPLVTALLRASGVPVLDSRVFEGDDLVASVRRVFREYDAFIHSCDKDFFQLLDATTFLVRKRSVYTERRLLHDYGLTPRQFLELQVLAGDSVDRVPGVPMWGVQSAQRYLAEWGSLKRIIKRRRELPTKLRNGLERGRGTLDVQRLLVKLRDDALPGAQPADFVWKAPDKEAMHALAAPLGLGIAGFL